MKLIIDGFTNLRQKVETSILQGLPVSPILLLIYISEVFSTVGTTLPSVICVLFVDNLAFVIFDRSINKVGMVLEKAGKIVLQ